VWGLRCGTSDRWGTGVEALLFRPVLALMVRLSQIQKRWYIPQ
jgi:hypothetical protein